jgi:chaperonin GroEL
LNQIGWGWDASKATYCNLFDAGVVDPAKVTINAIENSASVAGLVLTTECLVTDIPVELSDADKQAIFDAQGMGAGFQP